MNPFLPLNFIKVDCGIKPIMMISCLLAFIQLCLGLSLVPVVH